MSSNDTLPPKEKKFFFDKIHFDAPEEDEIEIDFVEEEPPPPPVFSEEELAEARKTSYERGKNDGMTEAHKSFEKQTEVLLEVIARDLQSLFGEEETRARLFETEALALTLAIFKKLFPLLNETYGLAEIMRVIEHILSAQNDAHEIQIAVAPAFADRIRQYIESNPHMNNTGGIIQVIDDPLLEAGDCRLRWKDGGGTRDISTLSTQIAEEIELLLAERPFNKDNNESGASASLHSDAAGSSPDNQIENQDRNTPSTRDGDS